MPKISQTDSADYQALFDSLPGAYIATAPDDPVFTIIAENKAHAAIAFADPKRTLGRPLFEVFPDTSEKFRKTGVNDVFESFRKVVSTRKPDAMPLVRYDLKDAKGHTVTKFWRLTHYPLFKGSGSAKELVGVFQATEDVTEHITASEALTNTRRQLDAVLSAGLIGTWHWNIPANRVVGDKYMADMFGVSAEDAAKGLPLDRFTGGIHPEDQPRVKAEVAAVVKSGDIFESEYRTISGDGSVSWIIARGRVERDSAGKAISFPGILIDITARKHVENKLSYLAKASTALSGSLDYHETLQTIAELMVPDLADWCTVDMLTGEGAVEQVAVAHRDPAKITWARKLRVEQGPPSLDEPGGLGKVLRTGEPEFFPDIPDAMLVASAKSKAELKLLRDLSLTSVIIVPIVVDGTISGAITMISSEQKQKYTISDLEMATEVANRASLAIANAKLYDEAQHELQERIRLENELREMNEGLEHSVDVRTSELAESNISLERSNQELQDFAYVASHDLQEPLRKIQAFGNLLQTEYAKQLGDGEDYLVRMRNAAARMSILIEDILSFSRVTTKGREFTSVNLRTIAREVTEDLEVRIAETNATIRIGELPVIHADAMQMRQLLQNLISNAIKFHRDGVKPVITISSTQEIASGKTKLCRLEIADNGLGFEEKYLARIFAVFQRLHSRENYEGTGIGLAVCRKIVERHGGHITASSKPGVGSTFIITLPARHKKGENLL